LSKPIDHPVDADPPSPSSLDASMPDALMPHASTPSCLSKPLPPESLAPALKSEISNPPITAPPPHTLPLATPSPDLSAIDAAAALVGALAKQPAPDAANDPALATVAAFADDLFTVNGQVFAGFDPQQCRDILSASIVRDLQGAHIAASAPARIKPRSAKFTYTFECGSDVYTISITLTRDVETRMPRCWMLAAINVAHKPP
jgi:hypothetical protein